MARILLIDDDSGLREVLSFTLRELGHEAEACSDGEQGLRRLVAFRPDVVITDLKMPGIDGLEVLRRIQRADALLPVILLTALGSQDDALNAMKLGACHCLMKPYRRDELKLVLDRALERRRVLLQGTHPPKGSDATGQSNLRQGDSPGERHTRADGGTPPDPMYRNRVTD